MKPPVIPFPTEAENQAILDEFFAGQQTIRREHTAAAVHAAECLGRLIATFPQRTGQSHQLRGLLYSLWNGQPHDLSDVLCLDWSLKKDFCHVVLAFGHDDFFYDAIQALLREAGQFDWFLEAHTASS